MNIAIFTPLPPLKTGIADYSYDLVVGLSKIKNLNITVYTNTNAYINDEIEVLNVTKINKQNYEDFELIIYQFGNNIEFHAYMYEILKKHSGIIHLHDIVLHQVLAHTLDYKNNIQGYLHTIRKLYGEKISLYLNELLNINIKPWRISLVTKLPCFEEFVQYSDACIVHSDFALKKVKDKFSTKPSYKIDQLYNLSPLAKEGNSTLRFGVFGGVEVNRRVETIIESFAKVIASNKNINVELIIVGTVTQRCKDIFDLPKKYNIEDYVYFYNYVDNQEFLRLLNSVDLLIALRDPTVGETSAVVSKALQLNIPIVVSNVGWYSELPDFVDKISNENIKEELTVLLTNYISNKNLLSEKRELTGAYSKQKLNFDDYIQNYYLIIKTQISLRSDKYVTKKLVSYVKEFDLQEDSTSIERISKKLQILF